MNEIENSQKFKRELIARTATISFLLITKYKKLLLLFELQANLSVFYWFSR